MARPLNSSGSTAAPRAARPPDGVNALTSRPGCGEKCRVRCRCVGVGGAARGAPKPAAGGRRHDPPIRSGRVPARGFAAAAAAGRGGPLLLCLPFRSVSAVRARAGAAAHARTHPARPERTRGFVHRQSTYPNRVGRHGPSRTSTAVRVACHFQADPFWGPANQDG